MCLHCVRNSHENKSIKFFRLRNKQAIVLKTWNFRDCASKILIILIIYYIAPPGVLGIWGEWISIFRDLGALLIILGEPGSKLIVLGI